MRATAEDFNKVSVCVSARGQTGCSVYVCVSEHRVCVFQVMTVVREQITRALAMKPPSLEQLRVKLRSLSYSEILRLRQSERMSQDDFQSPPIM